MAKIKGVKRLSPTDFPPEVRSWIIVVIEVLNIFFDTIIKGLRGKLTYADNFVCEVKEFDFTHNVELEISHKLNSILGCHILYCEEPYGVATRIIDNSTIGITLVFWAGAGTFNVKLILIGE